MQNEISILTDGGARGNPGPAACAIVVKDSKGNVLHKEGKYLGVATNNVAEYQGLLTGLTRIQEFQNSKDGKVNFYMDSELVIKQVNGLYKVKDPNLKKLYEEAKELLRKISSTVIFLHIPRNKNELADALVNEELDRHK